jgi:hypothetical protein
VQNSLLEKIDDYWKMKSVRITPIIISFQPIKVQNFDAIGENIR